jgi:hypothetical protein
MIQTNDNVRLCRQHLEAAQRGDLDQATKIKALMEKNAANAVAEVRRTAGRPAKGQETRRAIIAWLSSFDAYLRIALPENFGGLLQPPLIFLAMALTDLEMGTVAPFLRTPEGIIPGRSLHGKRSVIFKARVVLAAELIYDASRLPGKKRPERSRANVDDEVFKKVKAHAPAYDVEMSSRDTIVEWRSQIQGEENELLVDVYGSLKQFLPTLDGDIDVVDYLLTEITNPIVEI